VNLHDVEVSIAFDDMGSAEVYRLTAPDILSEQAQGP
jgi:hypothetical protein